MSHREKNVSRHLSRSIWHFSFAEEWREFRSHYHGQKWAITFRSRISRERSTDTARPSRLRGASFMGRSLSRGPPRYLASLRPFFFFIILLAVLDTFVARTFQMAFNRRSEPSRGMAGIKKKRSEGFSLSPGITSIKTPPRARIHQVFYRRATGDRRDYFCVWARTGDISMGYSYFPSPLCTRAKGASFSLPRPPPPTLLSSSKYLSCRSVIYHGPCPLKDFNSGRRPPFGERFSISVTHWDSQKADRTVRRRLISEFLSRECPWECPFKTEHIPLVTARTNSRDSHLQQRLYLIRF